MLAQVLDAFADDNTTNKMDKEDECKVSDYSSMKEGLSGRWVGWMSELCNLRTPRRSLGLQP